MGRSRSVLLVGTLILFHTLGCARNVEQPPAPPMLSLVNTAWPGDPIRGRTGAEPVADTLLQADVQWFALQAMPDRNVMPIDVQARLTMAPLLGVAVMPSGKIIGPVRFAAGDDAAAVAGAIPKNEFGQSVKVGEASGLIAANATRAFSALDPRPRNGSAVTVSLAPSTQPAGTTMLAITAAGMSAPTESGDLQVPRPPEWGQETSFLSELPCQVGATYVVLAPFDWGRPPWTVLATVVTLREVSDRADAVQKLAAEVKVSPRLPPTPGKPLDVQSAMAAAVNAKSPRAPLVNLTALTGSAIAHDAVLVANDELLVRFATHLRIVEPQDPEAMQFYLDRIVLQWLCEMSQKNALPPELMSVLSLHTGELVRRPDAVIELLKGVQTSAALNDRIIAENYIALEDSSPAARVRAFDWLTTRGKAPAGFDPLADARSRRAAIEKTLNP